MYIDITERTADLTEDQMHFVHSFGEHAHFFMQRMRSARFEEIGEAMERHRKKAGITQGEIYRAISDAHEPIHECQPTREEAVDFLAPMLRGDTELADHVYDFIRVMQAVHLATYAHALNRVGALRADDKEPQERDEELKAVLRSIGHGGWEAKTVVDRFHEALDDHARSSTYDRRRA